MRMADRISARIAASLDQARVTVIDDSARHHGHAGAREGGESHFKVEVVSPSFAGKTRVARQRLVYDALKAEFADGVHALEVKTMTPEEAAR
jgi:BolA protein